MVRGWLSTSPLLAVRKISKKETAMNKVTQFIFLLCLVVSFQVVYAEEDTNTALQKTQDCLRNQNCESAKTPQGQAADQKALEAVGGNVQDKQQMYNISADIMPILMQQTGGDQQKMQVLMLKAQTDPEGFFNSLSPDAQAKIKSLAITVEKNKKLDTNKQ
jgi:hypothetical protein